MHIVMLDQGSLGPDDLDFSALVSPDDRWALYHNTGVDAVLPRIREAEIVLTNKVPLSAAAIAGAERLQLIGVMATGTNNVDLAAARERGIAVSNCVGYATAAVVQHCFALITALATRLPQYAGAARDGRWSGGEFFCLLHEPIMELAGKCLGIVGYGELGRAVAAVARAFGMDVKVAQSLNPDAAGDDTVSREPLAAVLAAADVLSLHCPLTEATRGLIDDRALAAMKPGALLINTARGPIVDEAALCRALREGHLGGAGLDVLSSEPPPADHPLLRAGFDNLIITPHSAWASRESRQRLVDQLATVLAGFRRGERVNAVV